MLRLSTKSKTLIKNNLYEFMESSLIDNEWGLIFKKSHVFDICILEHDKNWVVKQNIVNGI